MYLQIPRTPITRSGGHVKQWVEVHRHVSPKLSFSLFEVIMHAQGGAYSTVV